MPKHDASRHHGSRRSSLAIALSLCLGLNLALSQDVSAVDTYRIGLETASRLAQIEWYDYALLQIEQLLQSHPDKAEALNVRKAQMLFYRGKRDEAFALLDAIPKSSRYANEAKRVAAELNHRSGDLEKALALYDAYFKAVPSPDVSPLAVEAEFRQTLQLYISLLRDQGKAEKVREMVRVLTKLEGASGRAGKRATQFLEVQVSLDSQEKRESPDKKAVEKALETLDGLKFGGDLIAAKSYVQRVRALVLLGKYDEALKLIDKSKRYLAQFDTAMKRAGRPAESPLPGLFYYWAVALKHQAVEAHKKKHDTKAQEYLVAALKRCRAVTVRYPGAETYVSKATLEYDTVKKVLSGLGLDVKEEKTKTDALLKSKLKEGETFRQAGKYEKAIDTFLEGIRSAPFSREVPKAGVRLAVCYGLTDQFLRARTVADYMRSLFPDVPQTPDTFLKVGSLLYKRSGELAGRDAKRAKRLKDSAMDTWEQFVIMDENAPQAQDIAFMVAEYYYGKAVETAKRSANASDRERKKALKQEAMQRYRDAIPKYQRLVDNYGSLPRGIRALYKLGWIHYTLENAQQAADYFADYVETETLKKYGDDRVEALFRVGEIQLDQGKPDQARATFEKLITWVIKDRGESIDASSTKVKQRKEDATSYIAWTYDQKAQNVRRKLATFDERADQKTDKIEHLRKTIEGRSEDIQAADQRIAAAKERFREIRQSLDQNSVGKPEEATPPAENTAPAEENAENDEELRKKQEEIRQRETAKRQATKRANLKAMLEGEKLDFESRLEDAKMALEKAQTKHQQVVDELKSARTQRQETEERLQDLRQDVQSQKQTITEAEQALAQAQRKVNTLEDALTDVKQRADTRERSVRVAALRKQKEIEENLETARATLKEALQLAQQNASEEDKKALAARQKSIPPLAEELTQLKAKVERLDRQRQQLEKRIVALKNEQKAFTGALKINAMRRTKFNAEGDQVAKLGEKLAENTPDVLALLKDWTEKVTEEQVLLKNFAREDIARARKHIAELEKQIADLNKRQAPLRAEMNKWKRKAAEQFRDFLQTYPRSKSHAAANMARLGGIYLEFDEFDKAVQWLDKLRSQFPNSKTGKQALFDLGRALYENEQPEEAANLLKEAVAAAEQLSRANLAYIAKVMLEAGKPLVALPAAEELVRRSEDPDHEDYDALRANGRQTALFRAAHAALGAGEYDEATSYIDKLLEDYPNTGFFFKAMFVRAGALQNKTPPDYQGAIKALGQVTLHADDPVLSARAALKLGQTHQARAAEGDLRKATSFYQQVVLLADPEVDGIPPILQEAIYYSAEVFTRLGNADERRKMVRMYKKQFPNGEFETAIDSLPPVKSAPTDDTGNQ